MSRMMELILEGSAPPSLMRRAAQGGLSLPAAETLEILVALVPNRELGAEAERTLASWDEASLAAVAADPATAPAVLRHLMQGCEAHPALLSALCANPAVDTDELENMLGRVGEDVLASVLAVERLRASSGLLRAVLENPASGPMRVTVEHWLMAAQTQEADRAADLYLTNHAEEVQSEESQPFALAAGPEGEDDPLAAWMQRARGGAEAEATAEEPVEAEQLSLLQKLSRMRVGERIKLAMRGNREERMILIRDQSKMVALAVLESPKVSDQEKETFASMKNIQETVLRAIATKRNYIKLYSVLRALVNNPKTPIDVALPLLAHLMVKDLRALAVNKNVNETVRKLATKMFRAKTERREH